MTPRFLIVLLVIALLSGCASEDPNIVNPPPGNTNVLVRMFNMVPDDKERQLVMELGYQSSIVPSGSFTAAVQAPGDSSHLEIMADGVSEYKTSTRQRFVGRSVYDVFAVGTPGAITQFDTIMVSNANASLTTLPVAQLRVLNAFPDSSLRYDVRIGCPNGSPITLAPLGFQSATLYTQLPPGLNVLSVSGISASGSRLLGTFQCILEERVPYTIVPFPTAGVPDVQFMLYSEADFSASAMRPLAPVLLRDADIRVMNVSPSSTSVVLARTGQQLASGLSTEELGAYVQVPTCETTSPDVFEATYADGRTATDSTSLTVRGQYTIATTDDASGSADLIIVPPHDVAYGRAGKAVVRVVSAYSGSHVRVSVGARTDAAFSNGFSSGQTLTSDISFGQVSPLTIIDPGEVPVTISSALTPTATLAIRRLDLQADHDYILIVAQDGSGGLEVYVIDENDQPGTLQAAESAVSATFVNGSTNSEFTTATLGTVVSNATVYYRNSFTTSVPVGSVPLTAGSASAGLNTSLANRSLAIFTYADGQEKIIDITSPPLTTVVGQSQRRVINASADVGIVSVSYDTNYRTNPDVAHMAKDVSFGTASATETITQVNRGSLYVYDSQTLASLYTLPNDLGPLGDSYSLIFVGSKQKGYEVIVLQEF